MVKLGMPHASRAHRLLAGRKHSNHCHCTPQAFKRAHTLTERVRLARLLQQLLAAARSALPGQRRAVEARDAPRAEALDKRLLCEGVLEEPALQGGQQQAQAGNLFGGSASIGRRGLGAGKTRLPSLLDLAPRAALLCML